MKEIVTYCVEYRRDDNSFYQPSFHGFNDKNIAVNVAKKANAILHTRVVEQKRKVIKTFSVNK